LDASQSERLLRLSRIATRAWSVFGSRGAAVDWLKAPNDAIGGETPLARLDTDAGTSQVVELLERQNLAN
jgi:putative toxin-antitoxin system antitoxin component (TIGR02293 family)